MKKTLNSIAAFAMLLAASGCGTLWKKPPATTEYFKASFYRYFPTPPMSLDERADMVEFWCVNRPDDVPEHPICAIEDEDV